MKNEELKHFEELLLKKRETLLHGLGYFGSKAVTSNARDVAGKIHFEIVNAGIGKVADKKGCRRARQADDRKGAGIEAKMGLKGAIP